MRLGFVDQARKLGLGDRIGHLCSEHRINRLFEHGMGFFPVPGLPFACFLPPAVGHEIVFRQIAESASLELGAFVLLLRATSAPRATLPSSSFARFRASSGVSTPCLPIVRRFVGASRPPSRYCTT